MPETVYYERANSGNFTLPGPQGRILQLHREGIEGLDPTDPLGILEWPAVLQIDVYQTHVNWVLKAPCECGASMTTYYNPNCTKCDGLGTAPGRVLMIPHDASDEQSVNAYINAEGYTMFWARQSGKKTLLRDKTPVWNLDIPPINFHCISLKNQSNLARIAGQASEYVGSGTMTRKRNFAYHDEFRRELIAIQMEKQSAMSV